MSNDTDTRVVAAKARGAVSSTAAGNIIIYPATIFDTHAGYNTSTGRYTVPVAGIYRVSTWSSLNANIRIDVYKNGSSADTVAASASATGDASGVSLISCVAGDLLDLRPQSASGTFSAGSWVSFERLSGPATIAASSVVSFSSYAPSTQAPTANVTNLSFTSLKDSHNAWNGTQFVVPISGDYSFSASLQSASGGFTPYVYRNGTSFTGLTSLAANVAASGSCVIPNCLAGDILSVRANASVTVSGGLGVSNLSIFRLGGVM